MVNKYFTHLNHVAAYFAHLEIHEKRKYFCFALHHKRSLMVKAMFSPLLSFVDFDTHITDHAIYPCTEIYFCTSSRQSENLDG